MRLLLLLGGFVVLLRMLGWFARRREGRAHNSWSLVLDTRHDDNRTTDTAGLLFNSIPARALMTSLVSTFAVFSCLILAFRDLIGVVVLEHERSSAAPSARNGVSAVLPVLRLPRTRHGGPSLALQVHGDLALLVSFDAHVNPAAGVGQPAGGAEVAQVLHHDESGVQDPDVDQAAALLGVAVDNAMSRLVGVGSGGGGGEGVMRGK